MERFALFGGLLLMTACSGRAVDDDDDDDFYDTTGHSGFDVDTEDTGFVPSADAPFIVDAEVYCDYTEC